MERISTEKRRNESQPALGRWRVPPETPRDQPDYCRFTISVRLPSAIDRRARHGQGVWPLEHPAQSEPRGSGTKHRGVAVDEWRVRQRHPNVRAVADLGTREAVGGHAGDREDPAMEADRSPDDVDVRSEVLAPGRVAQDDDWGHRGTAVGLGEEPTTRTRARAQRVEVVRRHDVDHHALAHSPLPRRRIERRRRSASRDDRHQPRHVLERQVLGIGERAAVPGLDLDEPVRGRYRQGLEVGSVQHREHRGVDADANRERQYNRQRHQRVPRAKSNRRPEVGSEASSILHDRAPDCNAFRCFDVLDRRLAKAGGEGQQRLPPIPSTRRARSVSRHHDAGELLVEVADDGRADRTGEEAAQQPSRETRRGGRGAGHHVRLS